MEDHYPREKIYTYERNACILYVICRIKKGENGMRNRKKALVTRGRNRRTQDSSLNSCDGMVVIDAHRDVPNEVIEE